MRGREENKPEPTQAAWLRVGVSCTRACKLSLRPVCASALGVSRAHAERQRGGVYYESRPNHRWLFSEQRPLGRGRVWTEKPESAPVLTLKTLRPGRPPSPAGHNGHVTVSDNTQQYNMHGWQVKAVYSWAVGTVAFCHGSDLKRSRRANLSLAPHPSQAMRPFDKASAVQWAIVWLSAVAAQL